MTACGKGEQWQLVLSLLQQMTAESLERRGERFADVESPRCHHELSRLNQSLMNALAASAACTFIDST